MNIHKAYILLLPVFILCCKTKSDGSSYKTAEGKRNIMEIAQSSFDDTSTYFRIYVDRNERITLNGNPISIKNIEIRLQNLKNTDGLVFYSSYDITEDTPGEGGVIDLIKKYQLGIKTFTDSTFAKSFY